MSGHADRPIPMQPLNDPTPAPAPASSLASSQRMRRRPTLRQWLRATWLDHVTVLFVAAFAFPIYYFQAPFGPRIFPLDVRADGGSGSKAISPSTSVITPSFAYPARPQMISNWLVAIVAICAPVLVILLMQIRLRSFWDANNALFGLSYALLVSSAFQAATKAFVGGFRPNFYDVCQPDARRATGPGNKTGLNGIGFRKDMWTSDVCTTTNAAKLRNAMQGFPSGHSTTMMAAMLYLFLYLNAKLKVFADYHTPLWKLVVLVLPLLGAVLLCGTLIIDHTHSWYDIAGGATIGALTALMAYRMVYASLFDGIINHIPLDRNLAFGEEVRLDLVATSRAGWGSTGETPAQELDEVAAGRPAVDTAAP